MFARSESPELVPPAPNVKVNDLTDALECSRITVVECDPQHAFNVITPPNEIPLVLGPCEHGGK